MRDERGVFAGEVSPFYDPMISKLVVWGATRQEAIARMRRALGEYVVGGIKTTIPFHQWLMDDADFQAGRMTQDLLSAAIARRRAARSVGARRGVGRGGARSLAVHQQTATRRYLRAGLMG